VTNKYLSIIGVRIWVYIGIHMEWFIEC
jgi:hypothetical protein